MTNIDNPKKMAYQLGKRLSDFRKWSEDIITSESNPNANEDMREVVRQIDWNAYNDIINQLEFCHKQDKKH